MSDATILPPQNNDTPSTPPEVRVIAAKVAGATAALAALTAALTDWFAMAILGYLIAQDKIPSDPWCWVIAGLAGGSLVGKARGKLGMSTTAFVIGSLAGKGTAAAIVKKGIIGLSVLLSVSSCAHGIESVSDKAVLGLSTTQAGLERMCERGILLAGQACSGVEGSDLACYEAKRDAIAAACLRAGAALEAAEAATSATRQAACVAEGAADNELGVVGLCGLSAWEEAQRAFEQAASVISEVTR